MTMYKLCPCFVLALAAFAFAAVEIFLPEGKPAEFADQEGCYIGRLGLVVPSDGSYYPKDGQTCDVYKCNGTDGVTRRETCGALYIPPGCQPVQDYTKDYPECCTKAQCDTTTVAPTTEAPTTAVPTTAAPTTAVPTTAAPTTAAPTTAAPTTAAPTTAAPTTAAPTTAAPTTAAPTTAAPTTEAAPNSRAEANAGPGGSYARAYAASEPGKPPVTETFATPGARAEASAT